MSRFNYLPNFVFSTDDLSRASGNRTSHTVKMYPVVLHFMSLGSGTVLRPNAGREPRADRPVALHAFVRLFLFYFCPCLR